MLSFIPDSLLLLAIQAILAVGVVGSLLSFFFLNRLLRWFPQLAAIHLLLQLVSIISLVAGIYFYGSYSTEMEWRKRVEEMEAKVQLAEEKSKKVNVVIKTKIVERVKKIHDVKVIIKDRIVEKEKLIDAKCEVPPEAISILNDSAKLRKGTVTVGPLTPTDPPGDKK